VNLGAGLDHARQGPSAPKLVVWMGAEHECTRGEVNQRVHLLSGEMVAER
jgi:hypothetical protein